MLTIANTVTLRGNLQLYQCKADVCSGLVSSTVLSSVVVLGSTPFVVPSHGSSIYGLTSTGLGFGVCSVDSKSQSILHMPLDMPFSVVGFVISSCTGSTAT